MRGKRIVFCASLLFLLVVSVAFATSPFNIQGQILTNSLNGAADGDVVWIYTDGGDDIVYETTVAGVPGIPGAYSYAIPAGTDAQLGWDVKVSAHNNTHFGRTIGTILGPTTEIDVILNLTRTTSVDATGEAWQVGTSTKKLELGERLHTGPRYESIASIVNHQFIDDTELPSTLVPFVAKTKHGYSEYEQRMYFQDGASGFAMMAENDLDEVDLFFHYPHGTQIALYELEFYPSGIGSSLYANNGVESGSGINLDDFENTLLHILGKSFTITDARRLTPTGNDLQLTLKDLNNSDIYVLKDSNTGDSSSSHELIVNGEVIDSSHVKLFGTVTNNIFWFKLLHINMTAEDDYYMAPKSKLSENSELDEPELLFTKNWDIEYHALSYEETNPITITRYLNKYLLTYTNPNGNIAIEEILNNETGHFFSGENTFKTQHGGEILIEDIDSSSFFLGIYTPHGHYDDLLPTPFTFEVFTINGTLGIRPAALDKHDFISKDTDPENLLAYNTYGAFARLHDPLNGSSEELFIDYPEDQRIVQSYIVGKGGNHVKPWQCIDTDSGHDYYSTGKVYSADSPFGTRDNCASSEKLNEFFCDGNDLGYEYFDCETFCSGGECVLFQNDPEITIVSPINNTNQQAKKIDIVVTTDEKSDCYYKLECPLCSLSFLELDSSDYLNHKMENVHLTDKVDYKLRVVCENWDEEFNQEEVEFSIGRDYIPEPNFVSIRSSLDYFLETFVFHLGNTFFVVGDSAPAEDVIAVSDIAVGWQSKVRGNCGETGTCNLTRIDIGATKLASEIPDPTSVNLVSVGRPHNNEINNDFFPTSNYPIEDNTAIIKAYTNFETAIVILAGSDDTATRRAAKVLANFEDYDLNRTGCVEVNTTNEDNLVLNSCRFHDYPIPETRLEVTLNHPQTDDIIEGTSLQIEASTNIDATCTYWLGIEVCGAEDEPSEDGDDQLPCYAIPVDRDEPMESTGGTNHTHMLRNLEVNSTYDVIVTCEESVNNEDKDSASFSTIPKPISKVFNITSPVPGISSERRHQFNLSSSMLFEKITYRDNTATRPRETTLCRNCDSYGDIRKRYKTLRDGQHDLEFIGYLSNGSTYSETMSIFVDSRDPRITKSFPRSRSYTNGTFWVEYREANPTHYAILHIETKRYALFTPYENNQRGEGNVNLEDFDGQTIPFYIEVVDIAGNSDTTRPGILHVDMTPPNITTLNITPVGRRLLFDIDVSERVTLEYFDKSSSRPRWRTLCRNCDSYERTRSSRSDEIDMMIRATDKAGNTDVKSVVPKPFGGSGVQIDCDWRPTESENGCFEEFGQVDSDGSCIVCDVVLESHYYDGEKCVGAVGCSIEGNIALFSLSECNAICAGE